MNQLNLFDQVKVDEVCLIYKTKTPPNQRRRITSSKDAYDAFMSLWNLQTIELHEEFKVLLLNRSNRVLGIILISKGGISGTVVDIRQIYQAALKANASSIIACHNHPSGNMKPSESDRKITHKIADAGKVMDIQLLDHLILAPAEVFFSFADEGLI